MAPAAQYEFRRQLFDALSSMLPVTFEPHIPGDYAGLRGLLAMPAGEAAVRGASEHNISSYQVLVSDLVPFTPTSAVTFTSSNLVHRAFRNKTIADESLTNVSRVPDSIESLATLGDYPIWAVERSGDQECHKVGVDLPAFARNDFFHNHFRAPCWFSMAALLHFLRSLLARAGWPTPTPRATFIIDDPNLHSGSYGYIDFENLVKNASAHNYHATIATVPLDAWYFSSEAASLFKSNKKHISLMMHGVNHIADELAQSYAEPSALNLLATGLRRIATFEERSGLSVARIMAAPHGAFAEAIADPMLRLGYESACVSIGSLLHWNPDKHWPTDLGFSMAQPFGKQGFPVFHRTGICETDIRISAFLGHPVVIATHHQDCVSDFARLNSLANKISEIDEFQWMGIEDISRTNFLSKTENRTVHMWPYTRRFTVPISPEIADVEVHHSAYCREFTIDLRDQRQNESGHSARNKDFFYRVLDEELQISFPPAQPLDYKQLRGRRIGVWPVIRRMLTETRDRVRPMLSVAGEATAEDQD